MRAYIVFSNSYDMQVAAIASAIQQFLQEQGIDARADWYYDDTPDGFVEYGVKIDISGMTPDQAIDQLRSIWRSFTAEYTEQEVRLEFPA